MRSLGASMMRVMTSSRSLNDPALADLVSKAYVVELLMSFLRCLFGSCYVALITRRMGWPVLDDLLRFLSNSFEIVFFHCTMIH